MSVTSLPFYVVEMSQPKKHTNLIYVQKVILKNNSSSPSPPPSKKKKNNSAIMKGEYLTQFSKQEIQVLPIPVFSEDFMKN